MLTFQNLEYSKENVLTQLRTAVVPGVTLHNLIRQNRIGVPIVLGKLEDAIYKSLPDEIAKEWPARFVESIQPGTDLSLVGWKFLHWLLTDEGVNPGINHRIVRGAVRRCAEAIEPMTRGERVDENMIRTASYAAMSSADELNLERETDSAGLSASHAAWSAVHAAWSAADSTVKPSHRRSTAIQARMAATSAARSAYRSAGMNLSYNEAEAAGVMAAGASYARMADKLIELIKTTSNQG
jgi:hypothetical protein